MIELRETHSMGWGVFATRRIPKNAIISRCPADPFYHAEWPAIKKTKLAHFVFMSREKHPKGINDGFIAWGLVTKVNHNDDPNAEVDTTKENGFLEARLCATRSIEPGEQIFIRYENCDDKDLYPWYGG